MDVVLLSQKQIEESHIKLEYQEKLFNVQDDIFKIKSEIGRVSDKDLILKRDNEQYLFIQSHLNEWISNNMKVDNKPFTWNSLLDAHQSEIENYVSFLFESKLENIKDLIMRNIHETANNQAGGFSANDIKNLIDERLQEALDRYSADIIGLPDYALESAGGKIITSLTSATIGANSPGKIRNLPNIVLNPDNHLGKCWPMKGSTGTLGIQLVAEIIPTSITIDHVHPLVSLSEGKSMASSLHEFEVWGVIDLEKFSKNFIENVWAPIENHNSMDSDSGVLLGTFSFDPRGKANIQRFDLSEEGVANLQYYTGKKTLKSIMIRVLNNWGSEHFTCIYRIRVHGQA